MKMTQAAEDTITPTQVDAVGRFAQELSDLDMVRIVECGDRAKIAVAYNMYTVCYPERFAVFVAGSMHAESHTLPPT